MLKELEEKIEGVDNIDEDELRNMINEGMEGIKQIGYEKVGEKKLMDKMVKEVEDLDEENEEGKRFEEEIEDMVEEEEKGRD